MKRTTVAAVAALLFAGLAAGCADKYEKNTREELEIFSELNEVLAGVKDKATLDAAITRLEDLNLRYAANAKERERIGTTPEEHRREILDDYGTRLDRQRVLYGSHMLRIADIEGKEKLLEAIKDVGPQT